MNEMYIYVSLYLSLYFMCQWVRYQCVSLYGFILENCNMYYVHYKIFWYQYY